MTNVNPECVPTAAAVVSAEKFQKSSTSASTTPPLVDENNNKIEMAEVSDCGEGAASVTRRSSSAQENSLPISSPASPVGHLVDDPIQKVAPSEPTQDQDPVSQSMENLDLRSQTDQKPRVTPEKKQHLTSRILPSTAPVIPTSGGLLKTNTALPFAMPQYHRPFKPYYDGYGQPGIIPNPYGGMAAYPFTRTDKTTVRFLIPAKAAGAIIGKGGANIKELREKFQALIAIPDASTPERIVRIQLSDHKKMMHIIQRIAELLKDDIQKFRRTKLSYNNQQEETTEMRMLVHQSQAGAIIGPKGSHVKRINDETGAKINVQTEVCPHSTDKVAQITGTPSAISKAVGEILLLFVNFPPKGNQFFYDPNFYDPSYEYGGYGYTGVSSNFIAIQPPPFAASPYFPIPQTAGTSSAGASSTAANATAGSSAAGAIPTSAASGTYPQQIPSYHQIPTTTAVSSTLGTPTTQASPLTSYAPATLSTGSNPGGFVYAHPGYTHYMGNHGMSMYQAAAVTAQMAQSKKSGAKNPKDGGDKVDKKTTPGNYTPMPHNHMMYPGYYSSPQFYYQPYSQPSATAVPTPSQAANTQLRATATPFVMKPPAPSKKAQSSPKSAEAATNKQNYERRLQKEAGARVTVSSEKEIEPPVSPPTPEPTAGGEQKQDSQ